MATAIPFYKSPQTLGLITTFVSLSIAAFPKLGVGLGLTSPDTISAAVQNVMEVIGLVAAGLGTVYRVKSDVQPITLTQAAANVHPATIKVLTEDMVHRQNAQVAAFRAQEGPPTIRLPINPPLPPMKQPPVTPQMVPGKHWGK